MFKPSPRVVAIDDNIDHLERIVQAVREVGWPCQELLYDAGFNPELPLPLEGIRLVFLDIHLISGGEPGGAASKAGPLADALSMAIAPGPFVVIFWTEFPSEADEVMSLLMARARYPRLPLPLAWTCVDKNPVLDLLRQAQPDVKGAAQYLAGAVEKSLAKIELLPTLLAWESRIHSAAARTLDGLAAMAMPRSTVSSLEEYRKRLVGILQMIAKEIGPDELRPGQEWRAFERGFLPLLEDHLLDDGAPVSHKRAWGTIHGEAGIDPEHAAPLLNSHFLVDERVEGQSCNSRGIFCPLLLKSQQWPEVFNQSLNEINKEFFVCNKTKITDNQRQEAFKECLYGVITLGASCDHIQNKAPFPPCVLSVMIPEEYVPRVSNKKKQLGTHAGILDYPPFFFEGKKWRIALNFRYIRGFNCCTPVLGKPLLRLRHQIVNEISFKAAIFQARPGVVVFH